VGKPGGQKSESPPTKKGPDHPETLQIKGKIMEPPVGFEPTTYWLQITRARSNIKHTLNL
jgi:hypothetical protein